MKTNKWWMVVLASALLGFATTACDDSDDDKDNNVNDDGAAAILGTYSDEWDSTYAFTEDAVAVVYPPFDEGDDPFEASSEIVAWHIDDEFFLADNGDGTFSRYDWTVQESALYYCQIEYAAASLDDAQANDTANRSDLADSGCGGFPWTLLTPVTR
ncbi:MAG: hypothetical protein GX146_07650 [Myxococcales bacterium]|jgi:hypothetical protein|nr:hypothetical protein [Myxococcales bacterium]